MCENNGTSHWDDDSYRIKSVLLDLVTLVVYNTCGSRYYVLWLSSPLSWMQNLRDALKAVFLNTSYKYPLKCKKYISDLISKVSVILTSNPSLSSLMWYSRKPFREVFGFFLGSAKTFGLRHELIRLCCQKVENKISLNVSQWCAKVLLLQPLLNTVQN